MTIIWRHGYNCIEWFNI